MRTTTQDLEFEGYLIPKDEMCYIGTSVPHFMEEYFPDPERFEPERHLEGRREFQKPGVYSPFGRGPHTCLGQSLAEVLMGLIVSRVFHRLNIALDPPGYTLKTKAIPTPGPSESFRVRVIGERRPANSLEAEPMEESADG